MTLYKELLDFPGYRVGSDGSVWSRWKRKSLGVGRGTTYRIEGEWVQLSGHVSKKDGRRRFSLKIGNSEVKRLGYRLVLIAFRGPCPDGMETLHKNGKSSDDNLENLSWGTLIQNASDKRDHGTLRKGSDIPWSKLSEDAAREIARLCKSGESQENVAKQFGVSQKAVSQIACGMAWRHAMEIPA